jgi:hypothetical protein
LLTSDNLLRRTSDKSAITDWLRPEELARYDKMADPAGEVSRQMTHA